MKQWVIELPGHHTSNEYLSLIKEDNTSYLEEYLWQPADYITDYSSTQQTLAQVSDCAGHMEYMVFNTFSITSQSLIAIAFNAKEYSTHELFYSCVGCYLDMVVSRADDAAIMLVSTHEDKLNTKDLLNRSKEKKEVYRRAKDQLILRLQSRCTTLLRRQAKNQ